MGVENGEGLVVYDFEEGLELGVSPVGERVRCLGELDRISRYESGGSEVDIEMIKYVPDALSGLVAFDECKKKYITSLKGKVISESLDYWTSDKTYQELPIPSHNMLCPTFGDLMREFIWF